MEQGSHLSEDLEHMGDAFRPCPRGHGILMWTRCCPHLLGNCLGHQPPEDIPRHDALSPPPLGFWRAVILPNLRASVTESGMWARDNCSAIENKRWASLTLSKTSRMCSTVMPEGPERPLVSQNAHWMRTWLVSSRSNGISGTKSKRTLGIGSRGSGGLLANFIELGARRHHLHHGR